jgi:hypothetical protein
MFVAFDQTSSLDWTDSPGEMVVTPICAQRQEVLMSEIAVVGLESKDKKRAHQPKLRIRQETQNGLFFRLLSETINRKFTRVSAKFYRESIFVCPPQRRTPHFFCTITC